MAEEFTLRIIFWGLVALVPYEDETGVTALLVNPRRPAHETSVMLIHGRCTSGSSCLDGARLLWKLEDEELTIPDLGSMPSLQYDLDGPDSLRWLPHIEDLALGRTKAIDPGCLEPNRPRMCGSVQARFSISTGTLSSCHRLHTDQGLQLFEYRRRGGFRKVKGPARSLADAAMVEVTVRKQMISLRSCLFDKNSCKEVELEPEVVNGTNRITLVVSSLSARPGHQHFEHFFDLSKNPRSRRLRFRPSTVLNTRGTDFGSCEAPLTTASRIARNVLRCCPDKDGSIRRRAWSRGCNRPKLACDELESNDLFEVLLAMDAAPHNQAECDMVVFRR